MNKFTIVLCLFVLFYVALAADQDITQTDFYK